MENKNIDTKKLKLAQIRYFDFKHNGVEIPRKKAFVFVQQVGEDTFINALNPLENLPVFGRVPYTNTTRDGEDYGTKIVLLSGDIKSGPCYVMENLGMDNIFGEERVSKEQIEDFVLASNLFFMDRPAIIREKLAKRGQDGSKNIPLKQRIRLQKKLREDIEKKVEFEEYLQSCAVEQNTK